VTFEPTSPGDLVIASTIDAFVDDKDRAQRVAWLQRQGVADLDLLDALLDPTDPDLELFMRRIALDVVDLALEEGTRPEQVAERLEAAGSGRRAVPSAAHEHLEAA
jgi:hypothetical protein